MKKTLSTFFCALFVLIAVAKETPTVYVDKNGIMRWSNTHNEASFFGVNYTMPFAHAYRAAGYLEIDRKKAIDEDVYHFARLGFNAYRIHIWDVEISDAQGNLLENDHLDLLDYLIAKLKERNIHIVITTQTNFGNGYPEHNEPTGGFSYNYEKCQIHGNPQAIAAQKQYIATLVKHVNPYTGKAYKDDPSVIGFEINNEPCHSGNKEQVRDYINDMLAVLKSAGNRKPVFYNVSHNRHVVEAYYDTDIQGTTYQWYPTGLVSGHTRRGNFLPYIDQYPIPFSNVKGFQNKAKLVYEFDPADVLYSYLYPATVRAFRTAGFQWITQFAYDPMELAAYNTEYQTHYLNLAYTPGKAISMKISAEAIHELPLNKSYGVYPADTVFGNYRVSYLENLSELNSPSKFFYSNHTSSHPVDASNLKSIAGVGNSPVARYEGTGAYFINKLEDGVWRLEVMPDAIQVSDPFAKPSLQKEVMRIYRGSWNMKLQIPDLGDGFRINGINAGNSFIAATNNGTIKNLQPGVYLLQRKGVEPAKVWNAETDWNAIRLGEYAAPKPSDRNFTVHHQPEKVANTGRSLQIEAVVAGKDFPDSVLIYTDKVSFWNEENPYYKMKRTAGYNYETLIPASDVTGTDFNYNIAVFNGDKKLTYPGEVNRSPLDWDYTDNQFYTTRLVEEKAPIELFSASRDHGLLECYVLPEWSVINREVIKNSPMAQSSLKITFTSDNKQSEFYLRKYVADELVNRKERLKNARDLCLHIKKAPESLKVGFITTDGITYLSECSRAENDVIKIPLERLKQTKTALLPNAYPVFMPKFFNPEISIPFQPEAIESLELVIDRNKEEKCEIEIISIWIE